MWKSVAYVEREVGIGRFVRSQCGASAAEFALVFPVFMLCLFAITAFASTLFIENNMVNAARESVRQIAVQGIPYAGTDVQCDSTQAQTIGTAEYVACNYLTFWGTDFTVNANALCPGARVQSTVQISLDASKAAIMDVFGFFNGKTLNAEVSMRKEGSC